MPQVAIRTENGATKLQSLPESELRSALAQHNPRASKATINHVAKLMAVVSRIIADLPPGEQRKLPVEKGRLRSVLLEVANRADDGPASQVEAGDIETSIGEGLGKRLTLEEGLQRLRRYSPPRPVEEWAGPVGGAGEIEDRLGIPRSTLSEWHRRGVVIGLLRGERKRVYPLEQFIDARPIEGIGDITKIAPDARATWLWLRQPHGRLSMRTPLQALIEGEREAVVETAEHDFL